MYMYEHAHVFILQHNRSFIHSWMLVCLDSQFEDHNHVHLYAGLKGRFSTGLEGAFEMKHFHNFTRKNYEKSCKIIITKNVYEFYLRKYLIVKYICHILGKLGLIIWIVWASFGNCYGYTWNLCKDAKDVIWSLLVYLIFIWFLILHQVTSVTVAL